MKGVHFLDFLEVHFPHKELACVGPCEHQSLRGAAQGIELLVALTRPEPVGSKFKLENLNVAIGILRVGRIPAAAPDSELFCFLAYLVAFLACSIWVNS